MNKKQIIQLASPILIFTITSCGSSELAASRTEGYSSFNLSHFPKTSSLFQLDSGAATSSTGSPAKLGELTAATATTQFHSSSLLTEINTPGTWAALSTDNKKLRANQYYGMNSAELHTGGRGACEATQSIGNVLFHQMRATKGGCYLRGIPSVSGGVTVSEGSADVSTVWNQSDSDKTIKVTIPYPDGSEDYFVKIFGKNSIGDTSYKAQILRCKSGQPIARETIELSKLSTAMMWMIEEKQSAISGKNVVTAFLKTSTDNYAVQTSQARVLSNLYTPASGEVFKGYLSASGSELYLKRYHAYASNEFDKSFGHFIGSGSNALELLLSDIGYRNQKIWVNGSGQSFTLNYSGSVNFQDSAYSIASDITPATTSAAYSFTGDSFFTEDISAPTVDLSSYSCSGSTSASLTLDFSNAEVAELNSACQLETFSNYSVCNDTNPASAELVMEALESDLVAAGN